MDMATQVQILAKTVCISGSAYTLGKGMNPIILPPAWINSRADLFFNLGMATCLGEGKLNSNLLNSIQKLTLCPILLVWFGKYILTIYMSLH